MNCPQCSESLTNIGLNYFCNTCQISFDVPETTDKNIYVYERIPQIVKDFAKYKFPQEIKEQAVNIYNQVIGKETLKGANRRAMLCVCIYEAFKRMQQPRDPIILGIQFDVDKKQIRGAYDTFYGAVYRQGLQDMYPKMHLTAKQLLPEFLEIMQIDDAPVKELYQVIDVLYNENSTIISRSPPRDISICVAFWYNGFMSDPLRKEQVIEMTKIKLTSMKNILQSISVLTLNGQQTQN